MHHLIDVNGRFFGSLALSESARPGLVDAWARSAVGAPVPERPRASLEFVDYVVSDPERLAFTVNALLGRLCDELVARGLHARALLLTLSLHGTLPSPPRISQIAGTRDIDHLRAAIDLAGFEALEGEMEEAE